MFCSVCQSCVLLRTVQAGSFTPIGIKTHLKYNKNSTKNPLVYIAEGVVKNKAQATLNYERK